MTRNENLVVQLGKEKPCPVSDMVLEAEGKIFDAKLIFLFCEGKGEFNYFNGYQMGIKAQGSRSFQDTLIRKEEKDRI